MATNAEKKRKIKTKIKKLEAEFRRLDGIKERKLIEVEILILIGGLVAGMFLGGIFVRMPNVFPGIGVILGIAIFLWVLWVWTKNLKLVLRKR